AAGGFRQSRPSGVTPPGNNAETGAPTPHRSCAASASHAGGCRIQSNAGAVPGRAGPADTGGGPRGTSQYSTFHPSKRAFLPHAGTAGKRVQYTLPSLSLPPPPAPLRPAAAWAGGNRCEESG